MFGIVLCMQGQSYVWVAPPNALHCISWVKNVYNSDMQVWKEKFHKKMGRKVKRSKRSLFLDTNESHFTQILKTSLIETDKTWDFQNFLLSWNLYLNLIQNEKVFFQNLYFRVYSGFAFNNNPDFETEFTKCFRANWVKLVTRTFFALWKNLFQRCLVISFSLSS